MTYKCPKGHDSTDPDYCSECGTAIGAAPSAAQAAANAPASAGADICPDCQTPRDGDLQYCEMCRYDFVNHRSFNPDASAAQVMAAPPASTAAAPAPVMVPVTAAPAPVVVSIPPLPVAGDLLLIAISVDASLDTDHNPNNQAPAGEPDQIFHLDLAENTVGRESGSQGIHPEIVVKDKSVSRRHMKFVRNADGTYSALELGSANGTLMNGQPLRQNVPTVIKAGDEFVIGSWTRLSIRNR
jgi:hypothetical protein